MYCYVTTGDASTPGQQPERASGCGSLAVTVTASSPGGPRPGRLARARDWGIKTEKWSFYYEVTHCHCVTVLRIHYRMGLSGASVGPQPGRAAVAVTARLPQPLARCCPGSSPVVT